VSEKYYISAHKVLWALIPWLIDIYLLTMLIQYLVKITDRTSLFDAKVVVEY